MQITDDTVRELQEAFPVLAGLEGDALQTLATAAITRSVPAGTVVCRSGVECSGFILVLDGSVRVQKVSEDGHEIVLYRLGRGDACALSANYLMSGESCDTEGVAESEARLVVLPAPHFQALLARSGVFRNLVFDSLGGRLSNLIGTVLEVAFRRTDSRLAAALLALSNGGDRLACTHQQLALELGTAREVVSRQLKEFERRRWVGLHRGRIDILDAEALETLAS